MFKNEKLDDWCYDHLPKKLYYFPRRIYDKLWDFKYVLQRIFRSNHLADVDIFNLNSYLANKILNGLYAFKKMNKRGYPACFSEYSEHCGYTKEEYEKAKEKGEVIGGEEKKWEEYIDEMIYAFEYVKADSNYKFEKKFFEKYNCNWHEEKPENLCIHKWYFNPEQEVYMIVSDGDEIPGEPWVFDDSKKHFNYEFYYDMELHKKCGERAQKGLELFGKYFWNLWD